MSIRLFELPTKYNDFEWNFVCSAYSIEKSKIHKIQQQHFFPESIFWLF